MIYLTVFVPLHYTGEKGWIFGLVCLGNAMSVFHERLLLLKSATVNRNLGFDDVCNEKHVVIAYYNSPGIFEVSNITGEMVRYPVWPVLWFGSMAWEWEMQQAFFKYNNIKPQWINIDNYTFDTNETTGQCTEGWDGAYFIQRKVADYAIPSYWLNKYCTMTAFSPAIEFTPYYWLTRYPREFPPTWNLLGLFTQGSTNKHINIKHLNQFEINI